MKKSTLTILFSISFFLPYISPAQPEPRPEWVRQLPNTPSYTDYIYVYGWGAGFSEKEVELDAYKNALFYAFNEGGLIGFEEQAKKFDDIFKGNNIDAKLLKNIIPNRRVCRTVPIYISKTKIKIYILLKVQRDKSKEINFDNNNIIECETEAFSKAVEQYNQKMTSSTSTDEEIKAGSHKVFKGNSYLAWGMLDAGYPWNLSSSFISRSGGTLGIGFQFSIGCDFGGKSISLYNDINKLSSSGEPKKLNYLSYNAAFRLYPYKNFFFSSSYGTLGCKKVSEFNDSEGRFGTNGWRQGKGISIIGGYDLIPRRDLGHSGFLLSIGLGMAYDIFLTKWNPVLNLKVGSAWGISK